MKIILLISLLLVSLFTSGQKSISKKDFLKKPSHGRDIYDYLSLFKMLSCSSYNEKAKLPDYLDENTKKLYSVNTRVITTYENGIVFWEFQEYEGRAYELFIPMISKKEAMKLLLKLCKNMGGCIEPENTGVIFDNFQGGVLISWGGGC